MMAVAALLATSSSVNATLYASGGLTTMLAEVGQFPPFFGRGSRLGAQGGMLITSAIVLVVSNLVDLSAIASVGSACSLVIFLLVGVAGYRRRADTGSLAVVVLAAIAATAVVLAFFAVDTLRNAPGDVRRDRRDHAPRRRPGRGMEARPPCGVSEDGTTHAVPTRRFAGHDSA